MKIKRWMERVICLSLLLALTLTVQAQEQNKTPGGKKTTKQSEKQEVTSPMWSTLQAAYDYDTKKAVNVVETPQKSDKGYKLHIEFEGAGGDKVKGFFMRPQAEGMYPVVLLLHGLTSDKETMITYFGEKLVEQGVAVLALDAPYHGERKKADVNPSQPTVFPTVVKQGCLEWRRGLDYLLTRKDVDKKHIGLLGYSMGSMMGAILGAVDSRIGSFALCVGGDPILPVTAQLPDPIRDTLYNVCPSLYIGHIAPRPILMLNGKQDKVMPMEASARLYAAAKEPKQQFWYESGHILPTEAGLKAIVWLIEKVKPAK